MRVKRLDVSLWGVFHTPSGMCLGAWPSFEEAIGHADRVTRVDTLRRTR